MHSTRKSRVPGHALLAWFRIQYMLMLFMAAAGYLFYQNFAFFACTAVLLLLPLYSYFAVKKTAQSIKPGLSFSHSVAEKGTAQTVTLSIHNASVFPSANAYCRVRVYNAYYPNEEVYYINLPVRARQTVDAVWELAPGACGLLKVVLEECHVRDMCGLWNIRVQKEVAAELFVMPPKQEISVTIEDIVGSEGEDEEEAEMKKGDDPSQLLDIRSYIPGDRMQRVHWKLTARQDELMVKEYGMAVNRQLHILLELYDREAAYGALEAVITGFFNAGLALLAANERFMACWWNAGIRQIETSWVSSEDELYETLWHIYLCEPYREAGMALEQYYYEHAKGSATLCYLAPEQECAKLGGNILYHFQDGVVMACI